MIAGRKRLSALAVILAACSSGPAAQPPAISPTSHPPPAASPAAQPPQREEEALPEPREETASAALDDALYVIAGFDAAGRDTATVFVYRNGWSVGPRLPIALDHPSAATLAGRLYVAGGISSGAATRGVYRLTGDRWEAVASLRHARGALALVSLDGRLSALGGTADRGNVGPAEVYDPAANAWTDLPPLPNPRNHVARFTYQGMACVGGGRSPNTARVDCYDPAGRQWRRLPDLPRPTSGAGAAALDGEVVVAGGESNVIIDQLARLQAGDWRLDTMLIPRHGIQLAAWMGRAWACGGGDAPGLHATTRCTSIGPQPGARARVTG